MAGAVALRQYTNDGRRPALPLNARVNEYDGTATITLSRTTPPISRGADSPGIADAIAAEATSRCRTRTLNIRDKTKVGCTATRKDRRVHVLASLSNNLSGKAGQRVQVGHDRNTLASDKDGCREGMPSCPTAR